MMCYRDMTFCPFYRDCKNASTCHRPLTEDVLEVARRAEMAVSQFADKPSCHSDNHHDHELDKA